MTTLLTGGTGFLGRELLRTIDDAVVLTRNADRARTALPGVRAVAWQPTDEPAPPEAFRGVDTVFHLAGEPIADGRWTDARMRAIRDSRVVGTRNLVAGLAAAEERPRVLVSISAVGYYGDRADEELDERSTPGDDFLAGVCVDWEREAAAAQDLGVRVVRARLGVVLAARGGALDRMRLPFSLGLGGRIGDGRQWMSWIHVDDAVGSLAFVARSESVSGAVNIVAPNPVRNAEFTRALGAVLRRPTVFPVPPLALRAAFGRGAGALTASQRAFPKALIDHGYTFRFDHVEPALADALGTGASPRPPADATPTT